MYDAHVLITNLQDQNYSFWHRLLENNLKINTFIKLLNLEMLVCVEDEQY